jgi:hypothetical protein
MQLKVTWQGPEIDDAEILSQLPTDLAMLLKSINGFQQFGGGFHLRGACLKPAWHSLRHAWESEDAFHRHYRSMEKTDIPFAQDALGDQYFLRSGIVYRLSAECDEADSLDVDLHEFLEQVQKDPVDTLNLIPLQNFWESEGKLQPGQLLSVMPPFVVAQDDTEYSYRAIDALDRLGFLADLARQIRDLPDGASITFDIQ